MVGGAGLSRNKLPPELQALHGLCVHGRLYLLRNVMTLFLPLHLEMKLL